MTTQETNKLIAEFMGDKVLYSQLDYCTDEAFPFDDLHFHESWDWLMPVVEKIEGLGFEFFIVENRFKINHNTDQSIENVTYAEGGDKLSITYQGIVQFIEYYNNTNK